MCPDNTEISEPVNENLNHKPWNHAKVYGEISPDILNREVSIAMGSGRYSTHWGNQSGRFHDMLKYLFTFHKVGQKEGAAFCQGALAENGNRKKTLMRRMDFLGIDIDREGMDFDACCEMLLERGLFGVIYSTYSSTPALEKTRIVLLLKDVFALDGSDAKMEEWADRYRAVCKEFDVPYDKACLDTSRLFYFARHPASSTDHRIAILAGECLDLMAFEPLSKEQLAAEDNPFHAAGKGLGAGKVTVECDTDKALLSQHKGLRFAELFAEYSERSRSGTGGMIVGVCPFNDGHSDPDNKDDHGFFCKDGDGEQGYVAGCHHAHCDGRDRIDFARKFIADHNLTVDDLMKYVDVIEDPQPPTAAQQPDTKRFRDPNHVAPQASEGDWLKDLEAIDAIPPSDPGAALKWMNARYAASPFGTSYVVFKMTAEQLVPHAPEQLAKEFANRFVEITVTEGEGDAAKTKTKFTKLWGWWWAHPERRQYVGVRFRPHAPGRPSHMPKAHLPLWRGLHIPAKFSIIKPNHEYYPRMLAHMFNNMASKNPHWFAWQWCWFADILANPQVKPGTSLVIRGDFGTGKSLMAKIFCRLIPHNWTQVTKHSELFGDFNIHLAPAIFIVVEEGFWAGSKDGYAMFKDQITNDVLWVQAKFVDRCKTEFYGRFFIIGNADWIVPAHPNDRRFSVFDIGTPQSLWANGAYFDPLNKVEMAEGSDGLKAFAEDLLRTRIPEWIDLRNGLRTDAFQRQVENSMDLETAWMHHVVAENGFRFKAVDATGKEVLTWVGWDDVGMLSNQHLYSSYTLFGEKSTGFKKNPKQFGWWLSNEESGGGLLFGALNAHVAYELKDASPVTDAHGRKLLPWDASQKLLHGRDIRVHLNQQKVVEGINMSAWGGFGGGSGGLPLC